MKTLRPLLLTLAALLALATAAQAASKPKLAVEILDDGKKNKDSEFDARRGATHTESEKINLTARISNKGFDEVKGVTLKVIIFAQDAYSTRKDFQVKEEFKTDPVKLAFNGKEEIKLGKVEFTHSLSQRPEGDVVYYSYGGDKYGGWAAEIYVDGELVDTAFEGRASEKAYEELKKREKRGSEGKNNARDRK